MIKPIRVPACGPQDARCVIVGMAPGHQEEVDGLPFRGAAGRLLDFVLGKAGVVRSNVYITNVSKYMPPGHDLTKLGVVGVSYDEQVQELHEELDRIKPNCILALGDEALYALVGRRGVMNWRGSVLESKWGKVVPSIHPAAIVRSSHIAVKDEGQTRKIPMLPMLMFDVRKWVHEGGFKEVRRRPRQTLLAPTIEQVIDFCSAARHMSKLALDIETLRGEVSCIGFSGMATKAICIPFDTGKGNFWKTGEEEKEAWHQVMQVLRSPVRKIIQNALFELQFLGGFNGVKNVWWDTMLAQHVLYPELPKGLNFLTSLYTDVPYYKWRGREWRPGDPPEELWEYNGLDCMTTFEIQEAQELELKHAKLEGVFHGIVMPQLWPVHEMQTNGLKCDFEVMHALRKECERTLAQANETLDKLAGEHLNVNSPKQMREFLFGKMGLPKPRLKKGAKEVSTDEATLEKLALKHPSPIFDLVIAIRGQRKSISTYLTDDKIDSDGRMRSSIRVGGTETGRMASGRNIWKRGMNQQNIPKLFRRMFVADPGRVLLEADGAQAEARLVAWEAGEPKLKEIFRSGKKVHSVVASMVFEKAIQDLSPMEYDLGKRTVHGSNYGMNAYRFVEVAKKYGGLTLTEKYAEWLLGRYHSIFLNIKGRYHKKIQDALKTTRTLTTCWGRKRVFSGIPNEDMFKEGYAYVAQSAIADWLNLLMCRCYWRMKVEGLDVLWLAQIHDAFLISPTHKDVERCKQIIKEESERPFMCGGEALVVPAEVKVGDNWYEMN